MVSIEPVAEKSNESDVRDANRDVRRVGNTEQCWKNMRNCRVVKSAQNAVFSN